MKGKVTTAIWSLIVVGAAVVAMYCGYRIVRKEMDYYRMEKEINGIYITMEQAAAEVSPKAGQTEKELKREQRLAQYAALHEENPDMVGWITVEGTVIDYPVMQTPEEPQYYFQRNFHKEYSSGGMIFADASCAADGSASNLLLYGHHMRNGTMFAALGQYDSKEFWKTHSYVEYSTLEEIGRYQVVAAFKQPAENLDQDFVRMLMAQTDQERQKLLKTIKQLQFYDTGIEVLENEKLLTLATCEYTYDDGRLFVVAKKVEE